MMAEPQTRSLRWFLKAIPALAALAVLVVGVQNGTFAAADTDPYGYVSEADAIAHGALRIEQPFARSMPWPDAEATFAPPGWEPGTTGGFIVPAYPPGLPLVMAAFQRVRGRIAVFYVVPFLGALAVWVTGRLGSNIHGPYTGAFAAVLLATNPIFVHQVVQPVSDVPATAWWTISLALLIRHSSIALFGAGLAASMGIVTRPNLVPVGAVLGLFLVQLAVRADQQSRRAAVARLAFFVAGVLPGCLAIAFINQYLYGSPLRSGYAPFHELFAWGNAIPNLNLYPRWLLERQPFIYVALLAPWAARRTAKHIWLLLTVPAVVLLSYLFYIPFERGEWGYLRFLLPGYPSLLVLAVAVSLEIVTRITRRTPWRAVIVVTAFTGLATWQARQVGGAFATRVSERRYVDVGRYIAAIMPHEAVFISGLHAGTIRYYSNRLTVRYDLLPPRWLDEAIKVLTARGYHPYIALDEGEESIFRRWFDQLSDLAQFDWPPVAERFEPVRVRIYDPADRARFLSGQAIVTGDILLVGKPRLQRREP